MSHQRFSTPRYAAFFERFRTDYEKYNMMEEDMKDEIDIIPIEPNSCETMSPSDHKLMFKTLENPFRRMVIKSIGESGKTKDEIIKEIDIGESQLKF